MRYLSICLFLVFSFTAFAQQSSTDPMAQSRKDAEKILKKLKARFDGFSSLQAQFTLEIFVPEQEKEIQKGKISQKGDQYRLVIANQEIISDGERLWFYIGTQNEVQLNSVDEMSEEDDILSPKALLKIYENEEYDYALMNEYVKAGKTIQEIEFKPKDRDSEYSKMRLSIDKTKTQISSILVFAKDGSRFNLIFDSLTPNKSFPSNHFTFNEADYPGVRMVDLRID